MLVSNRLVVYIRLCAVLRRYDRVFPVEIVEYPGEQSQRSRKIYGQIEQLLYSMFFMMK